MIVPTISFQHSFTVPLVPVPVEFKNDYNWITLRIAFESQMAVPAEMKQMIMYERFQIASSILGNAIMMQTKCRSLSFLVCHIVIGRFYCSVVN